MHAQDKIQYGYLNYDYWMINGQQQLTEILFFINSERLQI